MEEEEKSILASILGYAGETLDKPGRFFRGALSTGLNAVTGFNYGQADPRAMLNIVPFSDALGWTDPRKELNARQAYAPAAYGMNAPGSGDFLPSVGDAALDMVTDPSSYISFGFIPGAKLGIRALMEAPQMLGFGAKALNAVPDVVSAASKVAPDVITAAAKVMPDVVPTVVSTSKGFGDMTSAGINAMEDIVGRGPSTITSSGDTIFRSSNYYPGTSSSSVPVNFDSFAPGINPAAYNPSDSYFRTAAREAGPIPAAPRSVPISRPISMSDFDRAPDFTFSHGQGPFDYNKFINDAANYSQDLGKIDPFSSTMGAFSDTINHAPDLGGIAGTAKFADMSQPFTYTSSVGKMDPSIKFPEIVRDKAMWPNIPIPERTYIGAGIDGASYLGGKISNIPDGVIEKGGRFIRNAVPDRQALDEQRGTPQRSPLSSPLNPNRRITPDNPYGW